MLRILLLLMCTIITSAAFEKPSLRPEGGDIEWRMVGQRTVIFHDALIEAKERKIPIMVFFTCGCETCQGLWGTHFSDPDAVELSDRFIPLYVKGNHDLAREYDIAECPYIVFIHPKGDVMRAYKKEKLTKWEPADFVKRMKRVLAKAK